MCCSLLTTRWGERTQWSFLPPPTGYFSCVKSTLWDVCVSRRRLEGWEKNVKWWGWTPAEVGGAGNRPRRVSDLGSTLARRHSQSTINFSLSLFNPIERRIYSEYSTVTHLLHLQISITYAKISINNFIEKNFQKANFTYLTSLQSSKHEGLNYQKFSDLQSPLASWGARRMAHLPPSRSMHHAISSNFFVSQS